MPGIPQGRDVGEHGPKSVTLASVLDDGSITMEGTRQPGAIRTRRRRRLQGGIVVGPNRSAREGPRRGRPQIGIRSPRRATCRFGRDIDGLSRSPAHRSRGPDGGDEQRMKRRSVSTGSSLK